MVCYSVEKITANISIVWLSHVCLFSGTVKKRSWSWQQYLNEQKAEAAPVSLFTQVIHTNPGNVQILSFPSSQSVSLSFHQSQSFPTRKTGFKVGMKLEGIDPLHPSMFCVLTVAEVIHTRTHAQLHVFVLWVAHLSFCQLIGCRLRLHIDGYSDCYDFWVNSDSAEIRPAGWCKDNNHKLHPPKGRSRQRCIRSSHVFHHSFFHFLPSVLCLNMMLGICVSVDLPGCLSTWPSACLSVAAGQNLSDFDWTNYLGSCGSRAAPPSLFTSHSAVSIYWLCSACELIHVLSVCLTDLLSVCLSVCLTELWVSGGDEIRGSWQEEPRTRLCCLSDRCNW